MSADEISQAEKRRILIEERRLRTYQGRAMADLEDAGGRYSAVTKQSVTGSTPSSAYPRMPSGPWAENEMPPEPPLGYEIDAMEPVGELHEREGSPSTVAASAARGEGGRPNRSAPATQQFRRRI